MSSRRIEDCVVELQEKYRLFESGCKLYGIDFIVTCTKRSQEEQQALWDQGRTKPGPRVTWTLNSKHSQGKAFDVLLIEDGKPDWSTKNPKWLQMAKIGQEVGLIAGGLWEKNKDYPHF